MRQSPSTPERPELSREIILETALALIDEEGLDRCTMREIAQRLGYTDMALYKYFPARDDVLDGLLELLLSRIPPPAEAEGWEEPLKEAYLALFALYREHPRVLPALLNRPLNLPSVNRGRMIVSDLLAREGFSAEQTVLICDTLSAYTLGYGTLLCNGYFNQARPPVPSRTRSRKRQPGGCPGLLPDADWDRQSRRFERGLNDVLLGLRLADSR